MGSKREERIIAVAWASSLTIILISLVTRFSLHKVLQWQKRVVTITQFTSSSSDNWCRIFRLSTGIISQISTQQWSIWLEVSRWVRPSNFWSCTDSNWCSLAWRTRIRTLMSQLISKAYSALIFPSKWISPCSLRYLRRLFRRYSTTSLTSILASRIVKTRFTQRGARYRFSRCSSWSIWRRSFRNSGTAILRYSCTDSVAGWLTWRATSI